jgi:hypothetical protein
MIINTFELKLEDSSMKTVKIILLLILIVSASSSWAVPADHVKRLKQLKLLPGFRISIFADNLPNARGMALGDNGVVYIGNGYKGKVYAVQDKDNDGYAETRYTLAQGLNYPNGLAYRNGNPYVGALADGWQTHPNLKQFTINSHLIAIMALNIYALAPMASCIRRSVPPVISVIQLSPFIHR